MSFETIEGIGSTRHFEALFNPHLDPDYLFRCFHQNNIPVYITVAGPCDKVSAKTPDNTEMKASVFPNPFTSATTLKNCDGKQYEITDMSGRILQSGLVQTSQETLVLDKLDLGYYLIRLSSPDTQTLTLKLLKR